MNRYQVRVDVGANPATGGRNQLRRRFDTEREARDFLAQVQAEVAKGSYVHANDLTFAAASEQWLAAKLKIKPTTRSAYQQALAPAADFFGDLPAQQLTKQHFVDLVVKLQKGELERTVGRYGTYMKTKRVNRKPWAATTVNYTLMVAGKVMEDLQNQGMVVRNPVKLVDRLDEDPEPAVAYTEAQAKKLLKAIGEHRLRHAWVMAIHMMRRGEVAGGQWDSMVDHKAKLLKIVRTRVVVRGQAIDQESAKTRRSERTLPMTSWLEDELRAAWERKEAEKELYGALYHDQGYVVCDELGAPYHPEMITWLWHCLLRSAKLPKIRLHDARHTVASLMVRKGVDPAVVSAWLGHSQVSFTMDTYVHTSAEDLRPAGEMLARLLRPVARSSRRDVSHRVTSAA